VAILSLRKSQETQKMLQIGHLLLKTKIFLPPNDDVIGQMQSKEGICQDESPLYKFLPIYLFS
jgi:hypothetical protein